MTKAPQYGIVNTEIRKEVIKMKIIGKRRVGISLTGVWYCDMCNKTYHSSTLANITQKNNKICNKCLDILKNL